MQVKLLAHLPLYLAAHALQSLAFSIVIRYNITIKLVKDLYGCYRI